MCANVRACVNVCVEGAYVSGCGGVRACARARLNSTSDEMWSSGKFAKQLAHRASPCGWEFKTFSCSYGDRRFRGKKWRFHTHCIGMCSIPNGCVCTHIKMCRFARMCASFALIRACRARMGWAENTCKLFCSGCNICAVSVSSIMQTSTTYLLLNTRKRFGTMCLQRFLSVCWWWNTRSGFHTKQCKCCNLFINKKYILWTHYDDV